MSKCAAIYIRVSTDAQAEEGYSIDAQKEQLTAYCVSKGIKKYEYYIDGGWSGSNINRPEMQRLLEDCKDGKISHCIVYKLDRLSRSQKDTLYIIEDVLIPNDVAFVSLTETLDTSTPMGRLMIGILSAFAQLERENIRMRTRMGMLERVKDGYWMGGGRVPFGYNYDREQGILVQNKDSDIVKQVYDLYLKGYASQKIADMLGLKYDRLANQILTRKTNYGVIEYNGEEYLGRHKPIISKETYDLAMREMERRSNKGVVTSGYLLTGLCVCGECGAKMRYQKWGKKGCKLVCYSQQKSKRYLIKDPNCSMDKVWANEVESIVIDELSKIKEKFNDESTGKQDNLIQILELQKTKLENKIKKLYNLFATSDDDLLLETINENKRQLNEIDKQLKNEKSHEISIANNEIYKNIIDNLGDMWNTLTFNEKQNITRMLIKNVVIGKDCVTIETFI